MSKMRSVRMLVLLGVMATVVPACGKSSSHVTITTANDPPIAVTAGPPNYDTGDKNVWFKHDLFVGNSGDRPIMVSYTKSATYLGNNQLLAADAGCGPGAPEAGEKLPSLPCTLDAQLPFPLAPHASVKVIGIAVYAGLHGMSPVKNGTYEWNKDSNITWRFADSKENHTAHVKLIYVRT